MKTTLTKYGINKEVCPFCLVLKSSHGIENRRINTAYEKEDLNWVFSCYNCYKETIEFYQEMWDEYYAGCL